MYSRPKRSRHPSAAAFVMSSPSSSVNTCTGACKAGQAVAVEVVRHHPWCARGEPRGEGTWCLYLGGDPDLLAGHTALAHRSAHISFVAV